jgi:hypothetical protein
VAEVFAAVELAGLVLAVGFVAFSAWCVEDARRDLRALRLAGSNGLARHTVRWRAVAESLRGLAGCFLVAIYAVAASSPPTPSQSAPTLATFMTYFGLLPVIALLAAGTAASAWFARGARPGGHK